MISINADDPVGSTFSAALVRNSGAYERDGDWFHDKTRDQVVALTEGKRRRLIDLEPYIALRAASLRRRDRAEHGRSRPSGGGGTTT